MNPSARLATPAPLAGRQRGAAARPAPMHVVLFGAGHVGHALVALLAHLPCLVQWVDTRDECFPDEVPSNVQPEPTDTPDAVVDAAPPGSCFLVMTHNHALDFALAERILRRDDFAYFGMIGSRTKRVKFERRLIDRGVPPERVADMVCPIGVSGIVDKAPPAIAVAVCAELLQARNGAARAWRKPAAAVPADLSGALLLGDI
ncbi:xanthine dehydrogenase accessory protein XdhC [Burkholderia gladioli]|uniref:xanthine dehydrogenase accessory protein XdhC n=1 Tax=Burkholderia gladioli TaxID=28095 RepID=UPI00164030FC|nr:xanthine dehydrogenase accessory protein XdhC [Burkholderia gladioli]MBU9321241.1 xanthine dehydrogenase accessory protein XdhC [Burkholderia gladioli]